MARARPVLTARTADKHVLYEKSVQNPPDEVAFLDRVYRNTYGRKPLTLREDFCGTAAVCRSWVESHPERRSFGVDLDRSVLAWGRRHNVEPLGEDAKRVTLVNANVLDVTRPRTELRIAFNFSYWVFHARADLLRYFRVARESLEPEGLFLIDVLGGADAQATTADRRRLKGFTYVWDQAYFNPIDNSYRCHIHFEFPDGSRMDRAFTYDWRLWGMMELRDLLAEAGFSRTDVYAEGTDRTRNVGNGVFSKRTKADNDRAWISYVVAVP